MNELLKFLSLLMLPIGCVLFITFIIVPWAFRTSKDMEKQNLSNDDIVTLLTVRQYLIETNDKVAEKLSNDIDKILNEH